MNKRYRKRKSKYSDKQIVDCYLKYESQLKAAEELGVGRETVARAVRRAGIKLNGQKKKGYRGGTPHKITNEQLVEACKTMTLNEIAEAYGMHPYSLPRRFKRLGVTPIGYITGGGTEVLNKWWDEHPDRSRLDNLSSQRKVFGDCWHYVASHDEKCKELHPEFRYIESKGDPQRVRLQCKKCGAIIERATSTFRMKGIDCDRCKSEKAKSKALQSFANELLQVINYKTPKTCKCCGRTFYSKYNTQVYCSKDCKSKSHGNGRSYRSRCKKYGVYYDPTVTRAAVLKRDNFTCKICGMPCDINDKGWGTSGDRYPTLDHIIPLKRGGTHTWGNVQCACGLCNSTKRDLLAVETGVS